LIEYLFTDDYIVARDYKDSVTSASLLENPSESSGKANDSGENALASRNPPESKLDIIKRVWEEIIPHRELLFKNGEITTRVRGSQRSYKAAEMSDGERVIFYLIGQALLAPIDGMIVIDEPELHLHESIQSALWNMIESERPDCLFVYLTHDIDFAASRTTAAKICVRGFDGDLWDWYLVPEDSGIPEDILLEILGSRKPTIFVEGDRGSTDYFVYEKLYPDFTIVPVGGCENVIHSTCSFEALGQLHRLSAHGLVDRDARDDDEIKYLNSRGVHVLDFSEAENLFLTKDVLRIVAEKLHINDFEALFNTIKGEVLDELKNGEEILISSITASKVERSLKNFDAKARGESELQDALSELVGRIDVPALYQSTKTAVGKILAEGDYDGALKIFNNKGLIPRISRVFDYRDLSGFIERLMSDKDGERLLTAMRTKAPQIEA